MEHLKINDNPKVIIIALLTILLLLFLSWIKSKLRYHRYKKNIDCQEAEKKAKSKRRYVSARMKKCVLERDDYTCQICGMSKAYLDNLQEGLGDYLLLEVDHIVPVKQGGSGEDEDNLQVLCWRCNRKKSGTRTNEDVAELIDYGIEHFPKRHR